MVYEYWKKHISKRKHFKIKKDILHWKPQLNAVKSVICGHDYYTDEEFLKIHPHIAGVKKAVDELLGKPDKNYSDGSWVKWLS